MHESINNFKGYSLLVKLLIWLGVFLGMMCIAMFIIQVITLFIPSTSGPNFLFASSAVQSLVAFIGSAFITAYFVSNKPLHSLALTTAPSAKALFIMIIGYVIAIPMMNQIIYWNANIHLPESMSAFETLIKNLEEQNNAVAQTMLSGTSIWSLVIGILVVGILPGVSEELLFRGSLQRIIASKTGAIAAIWISAFIFSAIHFQFFGFIPRLLLGAWFGYLLYWSGSVWTGSIAHAINNSLVVIMTWLSNRGMPLNNFDNIGVTTEGMPWAAIVSACAFVLFILIFRKNLKG